MVLMASNPARPGSHMLGDALAALFFIAFSVFLWIESDAVAAATISHPYATGFVKFGILATFGECLKDRIVVGHWLPPKLAFRFLIWGVVGIWLTAAFPLFDTGLASLVAHHMWPAFPYPFWVSMWINFFGGIAFFVMFAHYWANSILDEGFMAPWDLFRRPEAPQWCKTILLSMLFFWVPAQTITFLLPPVWRVLFAAYLGICLGLILSFAAKAGETAGEGLA